VSVILARHGDARNTAGKFHGLVDEPLTKKGIKEGHSLAEELKQYKPTMIYTSPMSRTFDTAKIISDELKIPIIQSNELLPLDLGDFVGLSTDEYVEDLKHYLDNPNKKIPGGQPVNEWAKKYNKFFNKIFNGLESNESVIFLTHGRNILLTKADMKEGTYNTRFDKSILTGSDKSTEHGGYAIASKPDKFDIVTPKSVTKGSS